MNRIESIYSESLSKRRSEGLLRTLKLFDRDSSGRITVDGKTYINFSSNDYLGLNHHGLLYERATEWANRFGTGTGASRLVTGNIAPFEDLERSISKFKAHEDALILASGFQANGTVLQAILDRKILGAEPLVFSDRLNHASMHFGCAAAGVRQIRYRHCDMDHLSSLLAKYADNNQPKFILTESVFSMDGDIAPMRQISELAKQHGAFLICDDAHATGILGDKGAGLSNGADLVIGTFSKAMGSFGAYVACTGIVRKYLINTCSGLIYSTALPPQVLGAIHAAIDLVPTLDKERAHVASISNHFRLSASEMGFDTGKSKSQIVPIVVGSTQKALELSYMLKQKGFWATAIRPPTVPHGTARIRFAFSATHSVQNINDLLEALQTVHHRQASS